ncbi:cytochrome P450, putative [Ixodes scapularis]|uniref:Cytochrome P450, putative n=1 Tax=Ixodes scapularis TaxID=6945 RepID=B7P2B1_IXOSC|nr:cytochrome P450, putative [Ixodes scapularis]|eukprot:XP_002401974.1 cytochrome P450, putative [Ixodes scapularis]
MLNAEADADASVDVDKLTVEYENESMPERAEKSTKINQKRRMTTEEIQANASTFLIAGFETTGTTLAFSAYLLAKHPDIQDKTREEVKSIIEKENGLTYDGVFSMRLLDQVISEVLRLYPPVVGFITRRCDNEYEYEGLKIPSGITVVVPAYQLHHDPEYWENPEEFDPERFSPENKDKIEPMAYQPFGNGPRNCVAMRFGQLTLKMTLAKLLSKYKFTLDEERHKNGLKIGSSFTLAYPEGGVWIYINEL